MASPGAIASSLKHFCWNPRKSDFFPSFDADIELDRNVIRPYKPITGKLKLSTSRPVKFHGGIRVQMDGNVRLRFQSKVDSRLNMNWAMESILKDAPEPDEGNYVESPLRIQLLGDEDDMERPCSMEPGEYIYPFTFHMTGEALPAPFRSQFGTLTYSVAAYMGSAYCYVQIAEKPVTFGGFLDLTQNPKALEPVSVISHLHESIFSCKPLVTFTLTSEKTGYHPGEKIPFTLAIDNPRGREIKTAKVSLLRKTTYNAQGAVKTTSVEMDSFNVDFTSGKGKEGSDVTSNADQDIMYIGSVTVPKPCIPSYCGKATYSVTYHLQYEVNVAKHPATGKGHAEILVGSTKPSAVMLVNRLQSRRESLDPIGMRVDNDHEHDEHIKVRPRSYSICSRTGPRPVVSGRHFTDLLAPPTPSHPTRTLSMMSVRDLADALP